MPPRELINDPKYLAAINRAAKECGDLEDKLLVQKADGSFAAIKIRELPTPRKPRKMIEAR